MDDNYRSLIREKYSLAENFTFKELDPAAFEADFFDELPENSPMVNCTQIFYMDKFKGKIDFQTLKLKPYFFNPKLFKP